MKMSDKLAIVIGERDSALKRAGDYHDLFNNEREAHLDTKTRLYEYEKHIKTCAIAIEAMAYSIKDGRR